MTLLSKLTLVIPTYNRQQYALRNMRYWSGTDVSVHVLDGSAEAIKSENLDGFPPNIHYHHDPVPFLMRLNKLNGLIETNYVSFLGDDEFFVPSALDTAIVELENDPGLVACCGQWIGKCLSDSLTVSFVELERHIVTYKKEKHSLSQETPTERMIFHMNPYNPSTTYSVCRNKQWLSVIDLICAKEYSCFVALELQFELSMSFYGRTKVIDNLMWLRSAENLPIEKETNLKFHSWYVDPSYNGEVNDFLDLTASALSPSGGNDYYDIRKGLEMACEAYISFCRDNYSLDQLKLNLPGAAGLSLPNKQKTGIKKAISKLPSPFLRVLPKNLRYRPYLEIARALESEGGRVDWPELVRILGIVREFHKEQKHKSSILESL